jgi:hypothetical protein
MQFSAAGEEPSAGLGRRVRREREREGERERERKTRECKRGEVGWKIYGACVKTTRRLALLS